MGNLPAEKHPTLGEGFAFFRWRILKDDCCVLSCWACQVEWRDGKR